MHCIPGLSDSPEYRRSSNYEGDGSILLSFWDKAQIRKSVAAQSRTDGTVEGIIEGSTTIVFHGGGNLGDLYPLHDNFRKLVIKRYPNNKIVILPQTIHFPPRRI
ncbi:polysaccharide pyruvyl transferase family protein (plasmid) [Cupriavidus necator]|nr:polysaccharide pyruvyl transferase family protein [Cupriavidus necator]